MIKVTLNMKSYQTNAFKACLGVPGASRFQTCHACTPTQFDTIDFKTSTACCNGSDEISHLDLKSHASY